MLINSGPQQAFLQTLVSTDDQKNTRYCLLSGINPNYDDYHAPSLDTPFVESNCCLCDFPAQIDGIVFSLAIFSQPSTHTLIL